MSEIRGLSPGWRWVAKGSRHIVDGWLITHVSNDGKVVHVRCPERRDRTEVFHIEVWLDVFEPHDFIGIGKPPSVVVGRWTPDGPEYSVAVGFRAQAKHTGARWDVAEFRDGGNDVVLRGVCEVRERDPRAGVSLSLSSSRFFDLFEPAPPESRWLDPASVPAGAPMPVCFVSTTSGGVFGCVYPKKIQSGLCAACDDRIDRRDYCGTPVLPPSALAPAPRWVGKPPRVSHLYVVLVRHMNPCGTVVTREEVAVRTHGRCDRADRRVQVRKVRDGQDVRHNSAIARWVLA